VEFWNFAADLEARGCKRAIELADVETALGAKGPVAITGYVFKAGFAHDHAAALKRYFAMLAKARAALESDAQAWAPIRARLGAKDDAAFEVYRRRYLEGVPKRSVAAEAADSRALFKAIADVGGAELTGGAKDLDAGAFYDPDRSE
jgi:NitT/TauT family transport system substrate-binding protein